MADPLSWSVPEAFEYTPKRDDYVLEKNHVARTAQKADVDEFVNEIDDAYPDGKVAAAAVAALSKLSKENAPFFLAVGMRKPHLPFTAPKRYWDMFEEREIPSIQRRDPPQGAPQLALHDSTELRGYLGIPAKGVIPDEQAQRLRRGYYAAMAYTDAQIGRVLKALERNGLHRNTDIVFWADHGFHLGEHGLWCKTTNYESDTHVPLIIVDANRRGQHSTCDAVVELLDIYPTLCEMCNVPKPHGLEGKSLVPWLNNAKLARESIAFSQFPRPWFYQQKPEYMGYSVRTKTHRYVEWRNYLTGVVEFRELYDMQINRRFEEINIVDHSDQKDLIKQLSLLLPRSGTVASSGPPRTQS
jgi:arylsulfatase A-like enzyme